MPTGINGLTSWTSHRNELLCLIESSEIWFFSLYIRREVFPKSYYINPKSDCIIFLDPKSFGSKSFSGWFGSKRTSVWFQINRYMVNTISFQFDIIRFRKDLPACIHASLQLFRRKKTKDFASIFSEFHIPLLRYLS